MGFLMENIQAIGIFDSRFNCQKTIIDYCHKHNLGLTYNEYSSDIDIFTYLKTLYILILDKLKNTNIEYLFVFGPYLNINYQNIDPKLFISNNFDLCFPGSIAEQESWSFFILKRTDDLIMSLEKLKTIDVNNVEISPCANKYRNSIFDTFSMIKNIFFLYNLKIIEKYSSNIMSTFTLKKDLFNVFCTSFFNDFLNFESKFSNFNYKEAFDIKLEKRRQHYFNDICFVSIFNDDNVGYANYSLNSIKNYCDENLISYIFFQKSLIPDSTPNWSKAIAIFKAMQVYETVVWIDSDSLITNSNFSIREFCLKNNENFIAFKDPSSLFDFNSGAMILKKSKFCLTLLGEVNQRILELKDKTEVYKNGGDQAVFNLSLRKLDPTKSHHIIMPSSIMNSHPLLWNKDSFTIHAMGYGLEYREKYLAYLYHKHK